MKHALALVALLVPQLALGLEVEPKDLGRSVCFLRVQDFPKMGGWVKSLDVFSSTLEGFRTAATQQELNSWMTPGKTALAAPAGTEMFTMSQDGPLFGDPSSRPVFSDAESERLFTFWQNGGYERIKEAIVIWKREGSKLRLEAVLDRALTTGIASAYFSEIHDISPSRHLLIGRTSGGDGGESWGSLWVGLWTEPRHFQMLYSTDFKGDERNQEKLDYKFDPKAMKLSLQKMNRTFPDDPNGIKKPRPPSPWAVEKSWAVDVRTLLKSGDGKSGD